MSDDKVFMSEELVGRVNLEGQSNIEDIERNTVIIVVKCGDALMISGMKYFRREPPATAIEVACSLDVMNEMISQIESGIRVADVVELHRGDDVIVHDENLFVDGYYVSDVDPLTGQGLFGLKLSEKKSSVL